MANKAKRRLQEAVPTEEDCGSSVIQWGDGVCDARLNNELCNFDGGDCCAQTCVLSPLYPESCLYFDCLDPAIGADVSTASPTALFAFYGTYFTPYCLLVRKLKAWNAILLEPEGVSRSQQMHLPP